VYLAAEFWGLLQTGVTLMQNLQEEEKKRKKKKSSGPYNDTCLSHHHYNLPKFLLYSNTRKSLLYDVFSASFEYYKTCKEHVTTVYKVTPNINPLVPKLNYQ
jgi:hypothetical protein